MPMIKGWPCSLMGLSLIPANCRLKQRCRVTDQDGLIPAELPSDARADAVAAVQELEIEIRNQADTPTETRDLMVDLLRLIRENLARMAPEQFGRAVTIIRDNISSDYLDPDFWRGVGMVLRYQIDDIAGLIQFLWHDEYTTDT